MIKMRNINSGIAVFLLYLSPVQLSAQAKLTLDFTKQGAAVSPMLYGLIFKMNINGLHFFRSIYNFYEKILIDKELIRKKKIINQRKIYFSNK